jgi:hypothetical protein
MGFVYFLKPVGSDGPVKIGHARYPHERLAQYMKWSPVELEIAAIAHVPDYRHDERCEAQFHGKYRDQHTHHEWFEWSPELQKDIDAINSGEFVFADLPDPRPLRTGRKLPPRTEIAKVSCGLWQRATRVIQSHGEPPSHVRSAMHRMRYCRYRDYEDRLRACEVVWRWLELRHPRPKSNSTVLIRKLLLERDGAGMVA